MLEALLAFGVPIGLIVLGFVVGSRREQRHLADLERRESAVAAVTVLDVGQIPQGMSITDGSLVMGEVVIAADYFKSFGAALRNLFGGEMRTYQTLLSRARREARLRMVEQAQARGANLVVNTRFEWSDVGPRIPSAEMFCYGTAIRSG